MAQDFLTLEGPSHKQKCPCALDFLSLGEKLSTDETLGWNWRGYTRAKRWSSPPVSENKSWTPGKQIKIFSTPIPRKPSIQEEASIREMNIDRKRRGVSAFISDPMRITALGESLTKTAAFKRAAALENRAALTARQGTSMWVESDEAERQNAMAKRLEILTKDASADVTEKTPDLFSIYANGEELALGSWFSRAFTPPRAVRNIVRRIVPRQVSRLFNIKTYKPSKAVGKALRYAGAIAFTFGTGGAGLFMGKTRNKMFGLTGGEQKTFDAAAKAGRVIAAVAVTVATGAALAPAIGRLGASAAAKGGLLNYLKTGFGKKFLETKAGGLIMKDLKSDALWKFVKGTAGSALGSIITSKINKNTVPPEVYASLPNNAPVEIPQAQAPAGNAGRGEGGGGAGQAPSEQEPQEMPPSTAGANSMDPVTQENPDSDNSMATLPPAPTPPAFDDMTMPELTDTERQKYDEAAEAPPEEAPVEETQASKFEKNFDQALSGVRSRSLGAVRSGFLKRKKARKAFDKKVALVRSRPAWL